VRKVSVDPRVADILGVACRAMGTSSTGGGEGPLKLPFGFRRRAPRGDGEGFLLERRRKGFDTWESEGWFSSRFEARRVARERARDDLGVQFRIRAAPCPDAD
jgi:hypothetical protein